MRPPETETLEDVANELRALPARQRQAVLRALSPAERSRMTALLNRPEAKVQAAPVPAQVEAIGDGFSPWLSARIRDARSGGEASTRPWQMTPATRQLLLKAVQNVAPPVAPAVAPVPQASANRSLLSAVGGMLGSRKARG